MKGIILAGGKGSRLYPLTNFTSKQLLPVYNKPMIYYPLSTLLLADVNDILLICNEQHLLNFKQLLGNGEKFGIRINYEIQKKPKGIADALIIGKKFISNDDFYLILGDNIFYGAGLQDHFSLIKKDKNSAYIFGSYVNNPSDFGVVSKNKNRLEIEEKPNLPKSKTAVTGLYFYPNKVLKYIDDLVESDRGELEISDFNNILIKNNLLKLIELGRGYAWFDCGTSQGLLEAALFIKTVEVLQGIKIGCPEEISINKELISLIKLKSYLENIPNSEYKDYLKTLL